MWLVDRASERVSGWVSRARAGDKTVIAVGVTAVGAVAYFAASFLLAPGDGERYMNDDQRTFARPFEVAVEGQQVKVHRVEPKHVAAAAATLAAANTSDPMIVASAAQNMDATARKLACEWLYGVMLKACVPSSYGSITLETENSNAVAVWFPRGMDISHSSLAWHGAWQYAWKFSGWERRGRFFGYSAAIRAVKRREMAGHAGSFFYLLTYARRPELSEEAGSRNLKAVLLPVLQRADFLGQPCYVEVTNPKDLPLFASLGFVRVEENNVPYTFTLFDTHVEVLKREARTS